MSNNVDSPNFVGILRVANELGFKVNQKRQAQLCQFIVNLGFTQKSRPYKLYSGEIKYAKYY